VRPNGSKEGGGIPDRRDRTARELCRVRNLGTGDRELEKDAEGRREERGAEGGRVGFMAIEKVAATQLWGVEYHDRNYS
jgi:hypothetical protein